jgi:maltose alpha-D-glucosyltransferase / alpha-amylase
MAFVIQVTGRQTEPDNPPGALGPIHFVSHKRQNMSDDPLWYKDAIIYQMHVKAFHDANGDGMGDFAGLAQKLDYIQELGVNTIWLLPFYPSPLRDDGYDIADYTNVHPDYGTLEDFRQFINEAHRRGLKVITELVINHTSDQHPWFQAARLAAPGSREREFYVWSDDDKKFAGTRIIFTDTESSNWAWDPVARQYYWHRFFSHQPDLNHNNPEVVEAVIKVMRFWMDMGVDGMRLDAIPYLCVREGTNNENLPETHAVLKRMRAAMDESYTGRMFSPRPINGPRMCGNISAMATNATSLTTFRSCRASSWRSRWRIDIRSPKSSARRRTSRTTASGPSSCAITMS